ncbi:hypothetical protein [Tahibacter soli]|jgi:hypothetical protein|uniref:DUF1499 domain-containing protein n=1 Tax=Tahibacter soli TaxID=2983605 RepID=A0A9X4BI88_9GAMM|nr:hypothetical protein [Tahibacter soli]MDC8013303.1 hypothetical protein [Tahibacter soli]
MLRSRLLVILLLPILLMLMAARQAPLVDPDPIAIPAKITDAQVAKSIRGALINRKWTVTDEKPGEIKSTLMLRDHKVRIDITWDKRAIKIAYVDSENLKYEVENGKRLIHKNYLGWINNLVTDISANLNLLTE